MRHRLTLVLVGITVVIWPVAAFGADAVKSATSELLTWLVSLLASIILLLVQHAIRKWIAPKVSQNVVELLEKFAEAGVRYAEEKGRSAVKQSGAKMASDEKLERASAWLLSEADKFGVKNIDLERARKYVEAALAKTRDAPLPAPPVPLDTDGKVKKV